MPVLVVAWEEVGYQRRLSVVASRSLPAKVHSVTKTERVFDISFGLLIIKSELGVG